MHFWYLEVNFNEATYNGLHHMNGIVFVVNLIALSIGADKSEKTVDPDQVPSDQGLPFSQAVFRQINM